MHPTTGYVQLPSSVVARLSKFDAMIAVHPLYKQEPSFLFAWMSRLNAAGSVQPLLSGGVQMLASTGQRLLSIDHVHIIGCEVLNALASGVARAGSLLTKRVYGTLQEGSVNFHVHEPSSKIAPEK